jgi:polyisoprenoid-binding protein YceI
MGFNATGTVKRSDFGVSYGVPMVSDEVTFEIAAEFTKAE